MATAAACLAWILIGRKRAPAEASAPIAGNFVGDALKTRSAGPNLLDRAASHPLRRDQRRHRSPRQRPERRPRRLVASQFNRRQHRRVRRNNSLYPLEGVSRPSAPLACTRLLPGQANPLEGDRAIARSLPASPPPRCRRKQRTRPEVPIAPEAAMQREWFLRPRFLSPPSLSRQARQNYTKKGARRSERPRNFARV